VDWKVSAKNNPLVEVKQASYRFDFYLHVRFHASNISQNRFTVKRNVSQFAQVVGIQAK
jgi:hypothetical protein